MPAEPRLTETQRRILTALCRPCVEGNRYATPATNQEISREVYLSVDAVKAHLRALFRKFGVEELPHNQKRARLVELVLEGGHLDGRAHSERAAGAPTQPAPTPRAWGRRAVAVAGVAALAATLLGLVLGGVIGDGAGQAPADVPTKAEYVTQVNRYCTLALSGSGVSNRADRADRAAAYLKVIETMRGRLASLTPPSDADARLARFSVGLDRAADYTSMVAEEPPDPGSRRGGDIVAELTIAAGQVQAGALGYGLGRDCSAIGDLIAASARNAAGAP
jgi:hypothetical protein